MTQVAILEYFAPDLRIQLRDLAAGLELFFCESDSEADRAAVLYEAEYAIVRSVKLPESLVAQAPRLRLIHQWGTGTDGIPLAIARERGIIVARCPGVNAPSVADLTISLMLACLRRICSSDARIRNGQWTESNLYQLCRDLTGARVGLIGYGAIARAVEKRLVGFDCQVVHHRASGGPSSLPLDQLLSSVDIVSLHVPATEQTHHMINAATLAKMQAGAVLINTARGDLIDESALAAALASGQLAAAGLDAFSIEPLPADSVLRQAPNTILSTHAGGATLENFGRIVRYWANNIRNYAAGGKIPDSDIVT